MTPSVSSWGTSNATDTAQGLATTAANRCTSGCTSEPENDNADPDLACILDAWSTLPGHIRETILTLVRTSTGNPTGTPTPAAGASGLSGPGELASGQPEAILRFPGALQTRFQTAFLNLDRKAGSHNLVSLVDLRDAMKDVARVDFDRGLRELRKGGIFSLSAAEGRHGLKPEEKAAGILEDGTLLLYVSQRR